MGKMSSRKRSNMKKADRISGLSDHLLCHILEFLPTRSAMTTSVLSRRWEYVWPGILVLNLTNRLPDCDNFVRILDEQYYSLTRFLDRVLLHNRALCLERVDFDVHSIMSEDDLQEWFKVLSRRPIKEFNLFFDKSCDLPLTYLLGGTSGQHLVKLNIECKSDDMMTFTVTPMLRFDRLEIVNLSLVEITGDGNPVSSLVSASPCLRELVLFSCTGSAMNLRSSTMKVLKLLECDFLKTCIGVPNLEYFVFTHEEQNRYGTGDFQFVTDDMPCLSNVKIYKCRVSAATWAYIFHKVQHVIKLDVSLKCFIDKDNPTMDISLPYFERLKCVEIRCCEEHILLLTRIFLSYMPNCVSLILHTTWLCSCADLLKLLPADNSVRLGLHIEYIEIYGIGYSRLASVELLRYLLACCEGLKEIKLHLSTVVSSTWKKMLPKTIMNLPRPSTCKIIMCD